VEIIENISEKISEVDLRLLISTDLNRSKQSLPDYHTFIKIKEH